MDDFNEGSFQESGRHSLYIAFKFSGQVNRDDLNNQKIAQILKTFSPSLMLWDNDTWLISLVPVMDYWRRNLEQYNAGKPRKKNIFGLLREVFDLSLESFFADDKNDSCESELNIFRQRRRIFEIKDCGYIAGVAREPWSALLVLSAACERRRVGMVVMPSTLGNSLSQNMSWDVFWSLAETYGEHLKKAGHKKSSLVSFQRDIRHFRLAISRLNLKTLAELRSADEVQIGRRFGALCSVLWDWTRRSLCLSSIGGNQLETSSYGVSAHSFDDDFLWVDFESKSNLQVSTNLDFAANSWDEIEELVRQDMSRLCGLDGWGSEDKVVSLEWSVITENAVVCPILIRFRIPHHMRGENPHHKTALRQAHYTFENLDYYLSDFSDVTFKKFLLETQEDGCDVKYSQDDHDDQRGVVGWHLSVKERVAIPDYVASLFGFHVHALDSQGILNRFKVDAVTYSLLEEWVPEDSFKKTSLERHALEKPSLDKASSNKSKKTLEARRAREGRTVREIRHVNFFNGFEDHRLDESNNLWSGDDDGNVENVEKVQKKREKPLEQREQAFNLLHYFERPLFMFESPQPTACPEGQLIFLERVMDKWWKLEGCNYRRDYYLSVTREGNFFWVFKNVLGGWFKHGIYS